MNDWIFATIVDSLRLASTSFCSAENRRCWGGVGLGVRYNNRVLGILICRHDVSRMRCVLSADNGIVQTY